MEKKKYTQTGYELSDYPEVDEKSIVFLETLPIAYAVCGKECGARGFIVDGQTQICQYCGKSMFRTIVKEYKLIED